MHLKGMKSKYLNYPNVTAAQNPFTYFQMMMKVLLKEFAQSALLEILYVIVKNFGLIQNQSNGFALNVILKKQMLVSDSLYMKMGKSNGYIFENGAIIVEF